MGNAPNQGHDRPRNYTQGNTQSQQNSHRNLNGLPPQKPQGNPSDILDC